MKRLPLVLLLALPVQPASRCDLELPGRWNAFARAAKAYVETLQAGQKDLRLKREMVREWDSLNRCECF